jgi:rhodanese-related sulfurtransferase
MFGGLFSKLQGGAALPTIEHDAFAQAVAQNAVAIIDVREPNEFAAGHVPGAVNIPLSRFAPDALPKSGPVVLICQAGARSAKALRQALDAGRRDICHYAPGTGGWKVSGGALEL